MMDIKRILCVVMAAAMVLLSGCGSDGTDSSMTENTMDASSSHTDASGTTTDSPGSSSATQDNDTSATPGNGTSATQDNNTSAPTTPPTTPPVGSDWVELYKDGTFNKGLKVVSVDRTNRKVFDFGDSARKSGTRWELWQHFSKYDLISTLPVKNADGSVTYGNAGKRVTLRQENGENTLQLEMLASKEYDAPRKEGEDWPHLLIQQNLGSDTLDSYDQMIFSMTIRRDYIKNLMGADYDPGLHCYQTGMIIIVQNLNNASAGYGDDYFWFGIPGFDSRMEYKEEYCNVDGGKADASGKMIYQMGGKNFYDTYYTANPMTNEGKWVTVTVDILPAVKQAFNTAQRLGYMGKSKLSDLRLQGANFGCECTGTFDASISIKNVSLLCHKVG